MAQPVKKKVNGKANRKRGHRHETRLAAKVRQYYPDTITSRAGNRHRDAQGIDLCHANEALNGQLPLTIQAKSSSKQPNFTELLTRIAAHPMPVVIWAQTSSSRTGKFMEKGKFVCMREEDFWTLFDGYFKNLTGSPVKPLQK